MSWFAGLAPLSLVPPATPRAVEGILLGIGPAGEAVVSAFARRHGGSVTLPIAAVRLEETPVADPAGVQVIELPVPTGDGSASWRWLPPRAPGRSRARGRAALQDDLDRGAAGSRILQLVSYRRDGPPPLWVVASAADPLASGALMGLLASPALAERLSEAAALVLGPGPLDGDASIGPTLREIDRLAQMGRLEVLPPDRGPPPLRAVVWLGNPAFDPAADAALAADALRMVLEFPDQISLSRPEPGSPGEAVFGRARLVAFDTRTVRWPETEMRALLRSAIARKVLGAGGFGLVGPAGAEGGRETAAPLAADRLAALGLATAPDGAWLPPAGSAALRLVRSALLAVLNGDDPRDPVRARADGIGRAAALLRFLRRTRRDDDALGRLLDAADGTLATWRQALVGEGGGSVLGILTSASERHARLMAAAGRHERLIGPGVLQDALAGMEARAEAAVAPGRAIGGLPPPLARIGWRLEPGHESSFTLRLAIAPPTYAGGDQPPDFGLAEGAAIADALVGLAAPYEADHTLPSFDDALASDPEALAWLPGAAAPFQRGNGWLEFGSDQYGGARTTNLLAWSRASRWHARALERVRAGVQANTLREVRWSEGDRAMRVGATMPVALSGCAIARKVTARVAKPHEHVFVAEQTAASIEERFQWLTGVRWILGPGVVDLFVQPRLAELLLRAGLADLFEKVDGSQKRMLRLPGGRELSVSLENDWLSMLRRAVADPSASQSVGDRAQLAPERIDAFVRDLGAAVHRIEEQPRVAKRRATRLRDLEETWRRRFDHELTRTASGTAEEDERVLLTVVSMGEGDV